MATASPDRVGDVLCRLRTAAGRMEPCDGLARLLTLLARLHFVRGEYTDQLEAAGAVTPGPKPRLTLPRPSSPASIVMPACYPETLRLFVQISALVKRA